MSQIRPRFAQGIRFTCTDPEVLVKLLKEYDTNQASLDVMGFIGARLLADRDKPGHYMVMAEFAEVDGDRTAAEEAESNNSRNETEGWWQKFMAVIHGEPEWTNYDEIYWTGITGNIRLG